MTRRTQIVLLALLAASAGQLRAQAKLPIHIVFASTTGSDLVHGGCLEAFLSFSDFDINKSRPIPEGIPTVLLRFAEVPTSTEGYLVVEAEILKFLPKSAATRIGLPEGEDYATELYWRTFEGSAEQRQGSLRSSRF